MSSFPPWSDPFILMYEHSPISTFILNANLEVIWENEAVKEHFYPDGQPLLEEITRYSHKDNLLSTLRAGHPVNFTSESLFCAATNLTFHPYLAPDQTLLGVVLHLFGDDSISASHSLTWQDSLYKPLSIFTNQFRTPLSQIFSILNASMVDYQEDQKLIDNLRSINWSCYKMLRTVINFSEDSKIQSGQLKINKQGGDLCRFLRNLCADFVALADNLNISFYCDIPEHSVFTMYDPDILSCAILNIASNCCKFAKGQDDSLRLKLSIFDQHATVTISDSGVGMSPEVLEHVFDRFYSYDPETGGTCGDGLGLFITRFMLQLHDGTIAIQSKINEGTTVAFTFPLEEPKSMDFLSSDPPQLLNDRFSLLNIILSDVIEPQD